MSAFKKNTPGLESKHKRRHSDLNWYRVWPGHRVFQIFPVDLNMQQSLGSTVAESFKTKRRELRGNVYDAQDSVMPSWTFLIVTNF